jgi:hypothetical protein
MYSASQPFLRMSYQAIAIRFLGFCYVQIWEFRGGDGWMAGHAPLPTSNAIDSDKQNSDARAGKMAEYQGQPPLEELSTP